MRMCMEGEGNVVVVVDKVLSVEATPCFFKFWAFYQLL